MEEAKVQISIKELHEINELSGEYGRLQGKLARCLQKVKDRLSADWDLPFVARKF